MTQPVATTASWMDDAPPSVDYSLRAVYVLMLLALAITLMLLGERPLPDMADMEAERWLEQRDTVDEDIAFTVSSDLQTTVPMDWEPGIVRFLQGVDRQPSLLSKKDRERYRQAFLLQDNAEWEAADELANHIRNPLLHGHLLAQRYLHPRYQTKGVELQQWMERYADHPQAERIRQLAIARGIADKKLKKAFSSSRILQGYGDQNGLSGTAQRHYARLLQWEGRPKAESLWLQMEARVMAEKGKAALQLIEGAGASAHWRPLERDLARLMVANLRMAEGRIDDARQLASGVALRHGKQLPAAYWTAGLANWQQQRYAEAKRDFAALAHSKAHGWERSAGAYWAARAALKKEDTDFASRYLQEATRIAPRSFYGLLAQARLQKPLALQNTPATQPEDALQRIARMPVVQRIMALTSLGQRATAEAEIRHIFLRLGQPSAEAMLTLAHRVQLAAVQLRMARSLLDRFPTYQREQQWLDFARYPLPLWRPAAGFTTDSALLFAIAREESGFNPNAQSAAGAKGLMQLMPTTASYVKRRLMHDEMDEETDTSQTEWNVQLAQAYIEYLLGMPYVRNSLMHLLASYNAGPGTLLRWQKHLEGIRDPLLFMERLPSPETRNYLEQVIASYWIYRERMGLDNPTLEQLARGRWPVLQATGK